MAVEKVIKSCYWVICISLSVSVQNVFIKNTIGQFETPITSRGISTLGWFIFFTFPRCLLGSKVCADKIFFCSFGSAGSENIHDILVVSTLCGTKVYRFWKHVHIIFPKALFVCPLDTLQSSTINNVWSLIMLILAIINAKVFKIVGPSSTNINFLTIFVFTCTNELSKMLRQGTGVMHIK